MSNHRNQGKDARLAPPASVLAVGSSPILDDSKLDEHLDYQAFPRREGASQALTQPKEAVQLLVSMSPLRKSLIDELTERCHQFGIDATASEILGAGLLLLAEKTETALEVAMLQSLRADRTFAPRKSGRK